MVTALDYALDTEVIDVEEPPFRPAHFDPDVQGPPPAVGRVDTKDLIVHVHVEGYWHRLHPSTVKTACGLPVNYARSATRDGRRPEHPLAPPPCDCWTRLERAEADEAYRLKFGRDYEP